MTVGAFWSVFLDNGTTLQLDRLLGNQKRDENPTTPNWMMSYYMSNLLLILHL
jgi:hypothetical protein